MTITNKMPVIETEDADLSASWGESDKEKRKIRPRPALLTGLTVAALLGVALVLYLSLFYAGTDAVQGHVQRIFYIHVASFSGAAIAFSATVLGGIAYLRTRSIRWDTLALAGVEVGLMFSIITLATGSVWARPIWNTWWTWDPRLTSAAIMALTYVAYLMLRSGIESPDRRRTFASVYGILAISTVIFTFMIIRIRPDTIHPTVIGPSAANAQGGFEMAPNMGATLGMASFIFCCIVTPTLIWWRIRLENLYERVNLLRVRVLN